MSIPLKSYWDLLARHIQLRGELARHCIYLIITFRRIMPISQLFFPLFIRNSPNGFATQPQCNHNVYLTCK